MDALRVAVIGGGIAGLSAAYALLEEGRSTELDLSITVVEAEPRWGGKIHTIRRDGFLVEEGPDSFLATKPWALELCKELGLADQLISTNPKPRTSYVLSRGRLVPMPDGMVNMVPADIASLLRSPLFSWPGKLRMLLEFALPPKLDAGNESLKHLVTRRLGKEAYEKLYAPLAVGVYGGDGAQLSARAALPQLEEMEGVYGGFLRGAHSLRKARLKGGNPEDETPRGFLTPREGMAALVDALLSHLRSAGVRLEAGQPVAGLARTNQQLRLDLAPQGTLEVDGAILALPAYAAGQILKGVDRVLARELGGIEFAPATTVSLAYERWQVSHPLDANGYLIPKVEGRDALACTWTSSKFAHRAPSGGALFRLFFNRMNGLDGRPFDGAQFVELASQELKETLGVSGDPLFSHVQGWARAMPQYNVGHLERVERIASRLRQASGIFLAGNSYDAIGIPDTILGSRKAAGQMIEWLRQRAFHPERVYEH